MSPASLRVQPSQCGGFMWLPNGGPPPFVCRLCCRAARFRFIRHINQAAAPDPYTMSNESDHAPTIPRGWHTSTTPCSTDRLPGSVTGPSASAVSFHAPIAGQPNLGCICEAHHNPALAAGLSTTELGGKQHLGRELREECGANSGVTLYARHTQGADWRSFPANARTHHASSNLQGIRQCPL